MSISTSSSHDKMNYISVTSASIVYLLIFCVVALPLTKEVPMNIISVPAVLRTPKIVHALD